jgi:hypothetical protein
LEKNSQIFRTKKLKIAKYVKLKKQGVYHNVALPFTLKSILKGKRRRIMETQIISPYKNINFPKNPLKEAKMLQDIILLYNYKSQVSTQAKIYHLSKNLI